MPTYTPAMSPSSPRYATRVTTRLSAAQAPREEAQRKKASRPRKESKESTSRAEGEGQVNMLESLAASTTREAELAAQVATLQLQLAAARAASSNAGAVSGTSQAARDAGDAPSSTPQPAPAQSGAAAGSVSTPPAPAPSAPAARGGKKTAAGSKSSGNGTPSSPAAGGGVVDHSMMLRLTTALESLGQGRSRSRTPPPRATAPRGQDLGPYSGEGGDVPDEWITRAKRLLEVHEGYYKGVKQTAWLATQLQSTLRRPTRQRKKT
jgi:hypothetical protein